MAFGDRLKALRMQAGLTQEKLANALDVTKRTIINYELENSFPPINTLNKISKHFGVTIANLMTDEEEFMAQAYQDDGSKGVKEASTLVNEVSGLFAGGRLSEDDKDAVMRAIQNAYWIAKEESRRKYTPKKYRETNSLE